MPARSRTVDALARGLASSHTVERVFHMVVGGMAFGLPFVAGAALLATYGDGAALPGALDPGRSVAMALAATVGLVGIPVAAGVTASRLLARYLDPRVAASRGAEPLVWERSRLPRSFR